MTLNPSIILHVPANMDQRSGRMPGSVGSPPMHNVFSQSGVSSIPSHVPERSSLTSPSIPHSIDSLVHSHPHSGSGHVQTSRPSTIEHLPGLSRQRSNESSDGSIKRSAASDTPNSAPQDAKTSQNISKADGVSEHGDQARGKELTWSAVSTSSNRPVDHAAVISPNVNPFDKSRSVGEANIFDMLPLHIQSSAGKEYKDSVMAYSKANAPFNAKSLKHKHDKQPRSETSTPPGLTKHLEGHKASAAMAALAAKLHSQQVSQTARAKTERYLPNMDTSPLLPFKGEEHVPRGNMSPVMNIRSPPLPVTKTNTISYRQSIANEISSTPPLIKSTIAKAESSSGTMSDSTKTRSVNVSSGSAVKAGHGDGNKYKKSIVGHPHSMASLLGSHPSTSAPSTSVTSVAFPSPTHVAKTPPIDDAASISKSPLHFDQKSKLGGIDPNRSTPTSSQQSSVIESNTNQQKQLPASSQSAHPNEVPSSTFKQILTPTSVVNPAVKADRSMALGNSNIPATISSVRGLKSDSPIQGAEMNKPMQNKNSLPSNVHPKSNPVTKNVQPKSKTPRTSKTTQAKSVIRKVSPVVTKPSLSAVSTNPKESIISGANATSSAMFSQSTSSSSSYFQPSTSLGALKDHLASGATPSSQPQQHTRHGKESTSGQASHVQTSALPITGATFRGAKGSSADSRIERSLESESKLTHLSRLEQVSSRISAEQSIKSAKAASSLTGESTMKPNPSVTSTSAQPSVSAQTTQSPTRAFKQNPHTGLSSTAFSSKQALPTSYSKTSAVTTIGKPIATSRTSPQSVIKFSADTKPVVSSDSEKSVITPLPLLIKDTDVSKQKVIVGSANKTRPSKSSQGVNHTASVITVASSPSRKAPSGMPVFAETSNIVPSSSASKKPINVQIVTATSNVVACLSAAAALSQVQSIVKPNTGKPKSSSQTSVVSTILKVIPSLGSKLESGKDQSSPSVSASKAQGNREVIKPVSPAQTTQQLKAATTRVHATSVTFSTMAKVTVTPQPISGNIQATKATSIHSENSLLRIVTSSSSSAPSLNSKPTQKGASAAKQSRGTTVNKQTKAQRQTNVSSSPGSEDEGEGETSSNAPVASRTRPSTRRITSLSALGPGPVKKGGRSTPVTSPKGASVTSPKGSLSNKGQTLSPNNNKTAVTQAPMTIPGIVTSKATAKPTVQSVVGVRGSSAGKIVPVIEQKADNDQTNIEKDLAVTKNDTGTSSAEASLTKIDSTVAALAKLNESITIQTTRTVTSVADRPKKQKRSLASIVTDLASKGAHQTTVQTTASSTGKDSDLALQASNKDKGKDSTGKASPILKTESKATPRSTENATPNDITQSKDGMRNSKVNDTVQGNEMPDNKDNSTKGSSEPSKKEPGSSVPPISVAKPCKDEVEGSCKTVKQAETKCDLQETKASEQSKKDILLAHVRHNDTEHNYSEKASASKQNIT